MSYEKVDLIPFVRTYCLYFHFTFSLFVINSIEIEARRMDAIDKAIVIALIIVGIFTTMQFLAFFILDVPLFFNPFGKYGIGGEYDPYRFISIDNKVRPSAFYWEPSTNALVFFMLTNYLAIRNINKFKKYYFYQFLVLFLINSATGLFASGLTFLAWLNSVMKKFFFTKVIAISLIFFGFVVLSIGRMSELFLVGTSGYYRWGVPIGYFLDYIQSYPLGLPLGHLAYPLDNGIFVALIYTGVLGVIAAFILLFRFFRLFIESRITIETQLFVISIILLMLFNGAFLTPEMSFMISLITLAWKSRKFIA